MIIFRNALQMSRYLQGRHEKNNRTGFVPTMGALHAGHLSLLDASKKQDDITVASIFVNPAQFNDPTDFTNYPVTIEKDIDMLEGAGCDALFLPAVPEVYPDGLANAPHYDLGYLETVLEGRFRPGHFQGVCRVVDRLLNIIPAQTLYLGQKDYQQCMVLAKLIQLKNKQTAISVCPILRETDGLAMSSRNLLLPAEERKKAPAIFETLRFIKQHMQAGPLHQLKQDAAKKLADAGFNIDYVEIADAGNLQLLDYWNGQTNAVALAAVFAGPVRLIDNLLL